MLVTIELRTSTELSDAEMLAKFKDFLDSHEESLADSFDGEVDDPHEELEVELELVLEDGSSWVLDAYEADEDE